MKNNNTNIKKYSPFNLEQFKNWLRDMKETNATKFFEVYVDDFKVVPRTENIDDFDNHQQYVDDETTKMRVLVYNTQGSNRPTQHIFVVKETAQPIQQGNTLSGPEMEQKIEEKLKIERERWDCNQLKKDLEALKTKLGESENYSSTLQNYIRDLKEKLKKAEEMGDFKSFIKEFAPAIIPMKKNSSENLSGKTEKKPEEEASFKMKSSESESSVSEQEKYFIEFGESLKKNFTKEEFEKILSVIDAFAKDKTNIDPVMSLLNINHNNQTQKENGKV